MLMSLELVGWLMKQKKQLTKSESGIRLVGYLIAHSFNDNINQLFIHS